MIDPQAFTHSEFVMHAYASLALPVLSALIAGIPAFLAYLQAKAAVRHARDARDVAVNTRVETIEKHANLTTQLNGRLDELVKLARENGYQHGVNDGISAERARRSAQGGL
jgi:glutamine synthetase type III